MPHIPSEPDWVVRLRTAMFADPTLPETDEQYHPPGDELTTVVCERRLAYVDGQVTFHEVYIDPDTYRPKKTWRYVIEAGAFVGAIPGPVFAQQVAQLVVWLHAARPGPIQRPQRGSWDPGRFAQNPRMARRP